MTKRGNGEGSIFKRKDGRWVGIVDLGWVAGKRRRKHCYGKTRHEVQERLVTVLRALHEGLPVSRDRLTLGAFLEHWLSVARPTFRPATFVRYEQYVRCHVVPNIGRLPLAKLGPDDLQALYTSRLKAGSAPRTVLHLHRVLHRALRQAERWGFVARNVAALVDAPRAPRTEIQALTPDEARSLLRTAEGTRLEALYVLALVTGMRQGELLGLRWADLDTDAGVVSIRRTLQRTRDGYEFLEPKTARSRRTIEVEPRVVQLLRKHRRAQNEERLRVGSAWVDAGLVFTDEAGEPLRGWDVTRSSFRPLLRLAGLPGIRFHDLRHTAATIALSRGVHPKVVQEMLGHAAISVTLDTYSHVVKGMHHEAARTMGAALFG